MDTAQRNQQDETLLELRPPEISQIKDYAILLEMAGEYLCEESILGKLADGIEECLESLKDYVLRVRRRFVGKPIHEIDISGPYDEIQGLARSIRRPDEQTKELIRRGRIGNKLLGAIKEMAESVQELIERVQGNTEKYKKKDLLIQAYDKLKFFLHTVFATYKVLTRITLCIAVACLIGFVTLLATMETQSELSAHMAQVEASIQRKQGVLSKLEQDILEVNQKTEALENKVEELSREEKIKLIELKLRRHNLKEKREKIQLEIKSKREILNQDMRKLEELRKRSFLKRLLRIS